MRRAARPTNRNPPPIGSGVVIFESAGEGDASNGPVGPVHSLRRETDPGTFLGSVLWTIGNRSVIAP